MTVSITLEQTNTVYIGDDDLPWYRNVSTVVAADGISLALLVFKVADDLYSHPASARDVEVYPATKAEALDLGVDYYRQPAVQRDFSLIADAIEFATHLRTRLNILAQDYESVQDDFVGTISYVFPLEA